MTLSTDRNFTKSDFSVGTHTITLTVTDDDGATDSDDVTITVNAVPNQAPTARAGEDQSITNGEAVTLDGSDSNDTDGSIISYEWKEGTTVLASTQNFTKSDFSIGTHTITLTVTDDDGATDSDEVVVEVNSSGGSDSDDSGSGGGCTYNPNNQSIDLLMVLMMLVSLAYPLVQRQRMKHARK